MKLSRLLPLSLLLAGTVTSSAAWADHGHYHGARVGIYVGPAWGWYDPWPRYYYPPVIVAPAAPPTYIEQAPPVEVQPAMPQSQEPAGYWYYCAQPDGYYPYIKQCPGGWQRVAPQPPHS